MKAEKELTSEQKLFILDRLKLGCFIRHQIDGEMFYSESAALQLIKEFNSAFSIEEQPDINTPFFGNSGAVIPETKAVKDITDEEILQSIPYPDAISKHQKDINIGWIRCRKWMRDQIKNK
jgi:hypothetical protein